MSEARRETTELRRITEDTGRNALIDTVATVVRNSLSSSSSGRSYGQLCLKPHSEANVLPGQFAMLKPSGLIDPLLRRAMAYFTYSSRANEVEFIYQRLGRGTMALALLQPGDEVDILGPLGNTFEIDDSDREALLVAGGVGSAALFMLAEELLSSGKRVRLFIGGSGRGDLCGLEEFEALLGANMITAATIDGSYGEKGLVTSPVNDYLLDHRDVVLFGCGPDAMLHRVAQIASEHQVPTQLSLEAPMACGFGICVGCAVAVVSDSAEGFVYKKVCTDGPVFTAQELYW